MEDLKRLLAKGDLLSRVVWYELNRFDDNGQKISICVHEFLNGDHKGKFCAEPTDIISQCKSEYLGVGDSVEEALEKVPKKYQRCRYGGHLRIRFRVDRLQQIVFDRSLGCNRKWRFFYKAKS